MMIVRTVYPFIFLQLLNTLDAVTSLVREDGDQVAQSCDDRYHCLSENCSLPASDIANETGETPVHPCAEGYEARVVDGEMGGSQNNITDSFVKYTCCVEGYENIPVDVLQTCSVDACASPDGKGGYDCSADGFIHPLVCDQDTAYKFARKETTDNIYAPYICCTEPVGQSNSAMLVAASLWSALCVITFIACSILIVAILSSKKARSQGYNLYLVFLAVPDALFNIFSFGRNIVNITGNQLSSPMGSTVHALEWFHTAANMWLNALIIYQIHCMLLKARKFVRTPPPSVKQVLLQVGAVYFFAALWAAWSLVLLLQGSNIFSNTNAAWLTSKSLMCGPPFLYTIVACADVWRKQLLPTNGRTRVLSLYFFRVVLVFLLTWVPFLILVDVTYYKTASLWMLGLAYYFASLQGLLSVIVAVGKPDIKRAVLNLLLCRPDDFNETENGFLGSNATKLGKSILPSRLFSSTKFSLRRESSKLAETSEAFPVSGTEQSQNLGSQAPPDEECPSGGDDTDVFSSAEGNTKLRISEEAEMRDIHS
ncbi:hypothetical protein IV203_025079 [Nitzschia inconspicua]|uniref:Uncharacterized protein n=1 Tax=Nitzschia inconspicua TaxID=303405 RepID=A0A9K3PAD7_9STRA|nr:hypothetical protein IV203_025174 [Nitzschia inconspicua]KAG7365638.1 hypothetical protein IV203_025079 [Nitzschia inconspicua]